MVKQQYFSNFIIILVLLGITSHGQLTQLCPANPTDPIYINCSMDTGNYSDVSPASLPQKSSLIVMEYNIDRNGYGGDSPYETGIYTVISLLNGTYANITKPDVIVISEIARDCEEYGDYIDGPQVIASNLGMYYAYAVEYIEISQVKDGHQCTIGNAILSTYPILNITQMRFNDQCCMFGGRYGGRTAIFGAIDIGSQYEPFLIYSTHLESGTGVSDFVEAWNIRVDQAMEMASNPLNNDYTNVIIAGDMNSPLQDVDPVILAMEVYGFKDAFASTWFFERKTVIGDSLVERYLSDDDYILYKGGQASNATICDEDYNQHCYGVTDHFPIWITYSLNENMVGKEKVFA